MSAGGETIGIIGAGWVGLVTGACFADLGHRVIVRDVVPERIAALEAGNVPIFEPGLAELLERNKERMSFTLELSDVTDEADFLFICVGTPPTYSGDADLSAVWAVVDELPQLERRAILILKSTVPAGTGEKVRAALEARVPGRGPGNRGLPPSRSHRHRLLRLRRRKARRRPLRRHRRPDRL
jgi:UDPglucose 6-dehydrogenase